MIQKTSLKRPKFSLLLLETDVIAGILYLSQSVTESETSLVKISWHFRFQAKASPKLKEAIETVIEVGKVYISIGKMLIPVLLAVSLFLQEAQPNTSELPAHSESTEQIQ